MTEEDEDPRMSEEEYEEWIWRNPIILRTLKKNAEDKQNTENEEAS